jgi:hypothetical protein
MKKNIISCIFGHSAVKGNKALYDNQQEANLFYLQAEKALETLYGLNKFNVYGLIGYVTAIREEQFSATTFIGEFNVASSQHLHDLRKLADTYGLFFVNYNNDSVHNMYVWLPVTSSNIHRSLPMKHNVGEIERLNKNLIGRWSRLVEVYDKEEIDKIYEKYVDLYNYGVTDTFGKTHTLTLFKEKEYNALKAAIKDKIDDIIKTPPSPPAPISEGGRYTSKTLKELQTIAKARKLSYTNLKKADLIALLGKR